MAMARSYALLILVIAAAILMVEAKGVTEASHQIQGEYQLHRGGQYGPGSLKSSQCPSQCQRRCGKTQYKKPCLFFCQKCCNACLCVPPGYYGNKQVCPCYNNWKTKRGGPKCP
ncbi:Gibberellin-regulated protein 4 [Acorus calamus]|uniref:Gibberellin-regulated protein 4 n=1 Tax=Acorus calamus TaxID=4465 RepID=A0AAV9CPV0_ACOCL|nr:Gibberellin-regulated protein 4 [Acorus calamus]